jgi:hypothetical protein
MSEINSTIVGHTQEATIASNPLVQAELQRQQADLQDLQANAEKSLSMDVISHLRDRARRDAELFLARS